MGREGVNKCFTQQLPPMQVRAEIAGADPALPVLPLDLCASSLLRGKAEIPKSLLTAGCRDRAEVQSEKHSALWRKAHRQLQPLEGTITDTSKKHILLPQQTASALHHSIISLVPEEPQLALCCDRGS